MSLDKSRKVVTDFLLNKTEEVLSIKGRWGVGKTYFWNESIKKLSPDPNFCREQYAYVSLFGITDLNQLKSSIFENTIDKTKIGHGFSVENLRHNAEKLTKQLGRWTFPLLSKLPWTKDLGHLIHSAAFISISNALICLDDFERKGDSLSTKDILGLVSFLKEQRRCKVVLIFSDAKLDEESEKAYSQFREKVVDIEVAFSPTPEESTALAFSESNIDGQLRLLAIKLGISNIRVLKRISKAAHIAAPMLSDFEQEITHQTLQTLTLFGWCYYSHDDKAPSYEYVKRMGQHFYVEKKGQPEEEQRWDALLREYGYQTTDELDLALSSLMENGYADEDLIKKEAEKVNQRLVTTKSIDSFSEAWNLFHYTFANNEEDLVQAFETSLRKHVTFVSPLNLNGMVLLLRELGRNTLADELIDFYADTHSDNKEIFDISRGHFFGNKLDRKLESKFNHQLALLQDTPDIQSVLAHIAEHKGWNAADEEILVSATPDDFYGIFKSVAGKHLHSYVDASLMFGRFANTTSRQIAIAENAKQALIRIGSESLVNKIRVQRYGVYSEDKTD